MTAFRKVQGDINDTIIVTLNGIADLVPVASLEAHVSPIDGAPVVILPAEVLDATARTVTVDLGGASGWLSAAAPGTWLFEVQVTFNDGTVLTWPSGVPDIISVRADA